MVPIFFRSEAEKSQLGFIKQRLLLADYQQNLTAM